MFAGEPFMDEQAIALAVLDGFDSASKSVRATAGRASLGNSIAVVKSCRGSSVKVRAAADGSLALSVSVVTSLLSGSPELVDDAGLGSSLLARVIVGSDPAGCNAPRGFVALVSLRDRRLVVDALGAWTGGCGAIEPMTLRPQKDGGMELTEPIDDQAEPDDRADSESDEPAVRERRWSLRRDELVEMR